MTRNEAPRAMRLFDDPIEARAPRPLGPGAVLLPGFALPMASALLAALDEVIAAAPLRHMITPGGFRMTVAMTNCGSAGWVSDRTGYRYDPLDPQTGRHWPDMPQCFLRLGAQAAAQAGFDEFIADACLINRYEPGSRLSLHQDSNERDLSAPIVSVSLGVPAVFLFGGSKRADLTIRVPVMHGDVAVWGGPARLRYHGVMPLAEDHHPALGSCRINLTLRKAL
jgi:alkylated DNA repair protein (DNA oxidative demethylase)